MTPSTKDTGILIDKVTGFGERFGFPALVSIILIASLMYGLYFVLRYEVFYTRSEVMAMSSVMTVMKEQHDVLKMKAEASLELQAKQAALQCATCWNMADNQTEIKRCACNPSS